MKYEPTATEAAAFVGMKCAEFGGYIIIAISLFYFWIGTPA